MTNLGYVRGAVIGLSVWAVCVGGEASVFAQEGPPRIAVFQVKGPKRARLRSIAQGLVKGLRRSGVRVVGPRQIRRKARRAKVAPDSAAAAEAVNADYFLVTEVSRVQRTFTVNARLMETATERELEVFTVSYPRRKQAYARGRRLGRTAGTKALAFQLEAAQDQGDTLESEPSREPLQSGFSEAETADVDGSGFDGPIIAAGGEAEPSLSSERGSEAIPLPPGDSEIDSEIGMERPTPERGRGRENAMFRVGAYAGTQLGSTYAVEVDGQETGLTYDLGALFLVGADLTFQIPGLGLGFEAAFNFSPVRYSLDVQPPLDVQEPSGQFISAGGGVFWAFRLFEMGEDGGFFVTPLLGVDYASMSAESQGEDSVLLSWSSIDAYGGARMTFRPTGSLAFDVDGQVGFLLGFSESPAPATTGENGSGLAFGFGGQARYWLFDMLSVSLRVGYRAQSVSFTGAGTRAVFEGDPALVDASISTSDIKLGLGAQFAF